MSRQSYVYGKRWRYERAHGLMRTTDAGPVVAHIDVLLAAGWSLRGIADAAGVSSTAVHHIKARERPTVRNDTARRILAVRPETILARRNSAGFVLKVGAVRRIRALQAIGHRYVDITAAMRAVDPGVRILSDVVVNQSGEWITRATFDAICGAYARLCMTPGPSDVSRRRAVKAGYAPPLAWDEDSIDDPQATPNLTGHDEQAVVAALGGDREVELSIVDRREVVLRAHRMGLTAPETEQLTGISAITVYHDWDVLGLTGREWGEAS